MARPIRITSTELHEAQRDAGMWGQLDAIRLETGVAETECPPNAFTSAQYAERYGCTMDTAQAHIRRLVALGKLKSGAQRRQNVRGHNCMTKVYWPA